MITIAKRFTFDASHALLACPEGHKCRRLHGHTYEVEVRLRGPIDARGFVVDYDEIAADVGPIIAELDHRHLNDIAGLGDCSSTEVLVRWVFERVKATSVGRFLVAIKIAESSTTWAEVTAEDMP